MTAVTASACFTLVTALLCGAGAAVDGGVVTLEVVQQQLERLPKDRVDAPAGGPVPASPAVILAQTAVRLANGEQLSGLLRSKNAAVRALVAREVIRGRPAEVARVAGLLKDDARIWLASGNDVGPTAPRRMTVGALVALELRISGLTVTP